MNKLFELEKPARPVCDLMGNEIIRGHVIAYSKSGQGQRELYVGVVTSIVKFNSKNYSHSINTVTSRGWWGTEHRVRPGVNSSVVILNDPLYSLNSKEILNLFEKIDDVKGRSHGDIIEVENIYNASNPWHRELTWKGLLPDNYEYGVPIDSEQLASIPNKKAISKLNRQLKKKAAETGK